MRWSKERSSSHEKPRRKWLDPLSGYSNIGQIAILQSLVRSQNVSKPVDYGINQPILIILWFRKSLKYPPNSLIQPFEVNLSQLRTFSNKSTEVNDKNKGN